MNSSISQNWWLPFTNNQSFYENPRVFKRGKGSFLYTDDDREILDITACLWCMNLGHGNEQIAEAVKQQLLELDYSLAFNFGHPGGFEYAERIIRHCPEGINKVFYTNDGSGSVDTAIKMATQYWRARGQGQKTRFVSRMGGYHGINIGGTSLQGLPNNRKGFPSLEQVDFLPHPWDLENNAFSRGQPAQGGREQAEALLDIIANRGAENIAAVVVEPIAGAGGMFPLPEGYLQRLRELCDEHDILLIFDEVVTGFGRTGSAFACTEFGVTPDIFTTAKGITAGTIPMGAVFTSRDVYDTIVENAPAGLPEFMHGTTYSGHPVAIASALACLDIYEEQGLFNASGNALIQHWEDSLHGLRDNNETLIDVRNYGLLGAITFAPDARYPAGVGLAVHQAAFNNGLLCRPIVNHMVMSPPLTISHAEIDLFIQRLQQSIDEVLAQA
jgi:beta-alanine--pyruvate transaminase